MRVMRYDIDHLSLDQSCSTPVGHSQSGTAHVSLPGVGGLYKPLIFFIGMFIFICVTRGTLSRRTGPMQTGSSGSWAILIF